MGAGDRDTSRGPLQPRGCQAPESCEISHCLDVERSVLQTGVRLGGSCGWEWESGRRFARVSNERWTQGEVGNGAG